MKHSFSSSLFFGFGFTYQLHADRIERNVQLLARRGSFPGTGGWGLALGLEGRGQSQKGSCMGLSLWEALFLKPSRTLCSVVVVGLLNNFLARGLNWRSETGLLQRM